MKLPSPVPPRAKPPTRQCLRSFIFILGAGLVLGATPVAAAVAAMPSKPNLVYILCDDLGGLYDLAKNIGETKNVHASHPDVVIRLTRLLQTYIADGRSTPGAPQPNTGPVVIHRKAEPDPQGKGRE